MEEPQQPAAADLVPRPLVHAVASVFPLTAVERRHHHLLGQDIPCGPRLHQARHQPALLAGAEHGGLRVEDLALHRFLMVAVGLIGAVLPRVEEMKVGDITKPAGAVETHLWAVRERTPPQRHELIVGLVGIHAAGQKRLG